MNSVVSSAEVFRRLVGDHGEVGADGIALLAALCIDEITAVRRELLFRCSAGSVQECYRAFGDATVLDSTVAVAAVVHLREQLHGVTRCKRFVTVNDAAQHGVNTRDTASR